jgi:hypothetical protein
MFDIEITEAVANYEKENIAFNNGNKAAGTRARKWLMAIIKAASSRRKEIQSLKNADNIHPIR